MSGASPPWASRQCRNGRGRHKKTFESELDAQRDATAIGLRAYECTVCGQWHLGHPDNKIGAHRKSVRRR